MLPYVSSSALYCFILAVLLFWNGIYIDAFTFETNISKKNILQHNKKLIHRQSTTTSAALHLSSSKWDNLIDKDDEDDNTEYYSQYSESIRLYPDMKYILPNMKRQANTFDALVNVGGTDIMHDVYLRNVEQKGKEGYELWLVGKIARISDVSPEQAIERQWPLIERHAWTLRLPVFSFHTPSSSSELSLPSMEVWYAPGDSEYEATKNNPSVTFTKVVPEKCIGADAKNVKNSFVGFVGKAYGEGEPPIFVLRDGEGKTVLPEMDGDYEEQ